MAPKRTPVSGLDLEDESLMPPELAAAIAPVPPPSEISALARMAKVQDELRSAQRASDLLRFLSRQGQGFDESARIIAGIPGRMEVDLAGADRPVQHVQQRQEEAYKIYQEQEKQRREAQARQDADKKERTRVAERKEDKEDAAKRAKEHNKAIITAAGVQGKGREEAARVARDNEIFERENTLRTGFNSRPAVRQYEDALPQLDTIESGISSPGSVSDTAMMYSFLKVLDPTATVTDSDAQNIMSAGGVPERIKTAVMSVVGGGKFSPEMRASIAAQARQVVAGRRKRYEAEADRYAADAQAAGVDPVRVVGPWWRPRSAPSSGGAAAQGGDTVTIQVVGADGKPVGAPQTLPRANLQKAQERAAANGMRIQEVR